MPANDFVNVKSLVKQSSMLSKLHGSYSGSNIQSHTIQSYSSRNYVVHSHGLITIVLETQSTELGQKFT